MRFDSGPRIRARASGVGLGVGGAWVPIPAPARASGSCSSGSGRSRRSWDGPKRERKRALDAKHSSASRRRRALSARRIGWRCGRALDANQR